MDLKNQSLLVLSQIHATGMNEFLQEWINNNEHDLLVGMVYHHRPSTLILTIVPHRTIVIGSIYRVMVYSSTVHACLIRGEDNRVSRWNQASPLLIHHDCNQPYNVIRIKSLYESCYVRFSWREYTEHLTSSEGLEEWFHLVCQSTPSPVEHAYVCLLAWIAKHHGIVRVFEYIDKHSCISYELKKCNTLRPNEEWRETWRTYEVCRFLPHDIYLALRVYLFEV
jgi:hypothetical protein